MLEKITEDFGNRFLPPSQYGALTLAYIGDGVYEMYVRSYIISKADQKVNDLHCQTTKYVCAKAQAELYHKISEILTDEENAVFHRGRNTKSHVPKNAIVSDYRIATGVEAMIGYLYLKKDMDRIAHLLGFLFN